jgi:two-component system, OmpR family, response regulator
MRSYTAHILLIEPETTLAKFITLELKQAGFQVTEFLSECPDLSLLQQPPLSLAIFDLKRLKFSGLEAQRQIQAIAQRMPVIWLSAMDQDEVCQNFNQLDSDIKDHLLFKPFSIEELLSKIYARLNR